jgi:hypothetical protein
MEMSIYIGCGTLKMKCTQYETCGQVFFRNAKTMVFQNRAGGQQFLIVYGRVHKIKIFWRGGCPCPNIPPLKSSWGPPMIPSIKSSVVSTRI